HRELKRLDRLIHLAQFEERLAPIVVRLAVVRHQFRQPAKRLRGFGVLGHRQRGTASPPPGVCIPRVLLDRLPVLEQRRPRPSRLHAFVPAVPMLRCFHGARLRSSCPYLYFGSSQSSVPGHITTGEPSRPRLESIPSIRGEALMNRIACGTVSL